MPIQSQSRWLSDCRRAFVRVSQLMPCTDTGVFASSVGLFRVLPRRPFGDGPANLDCGEFIGWLGRDVVIETKQVRRIVSPLDLA